MHWLIVIGVVVVLFGAKRLPDAARSLGRSARILKAEVKEISGDEKPAESAHPVPPLTAPVVQQPQTAPAASTDATR